MRRIWLLAVGAMLAGFSSRDIVVFGKIPAPVEQYSFLTNTTLPAWITGSGAANGTKFNSSGTLVAGTTPRFDYNPLTLSANGLYSEAAATNMMLHSDTMATSWTLLTVTQATDGATLAPDGNSAFKFTASVGSGVHRTTETTDFSVGANNVYSCTVYAKGGTGQYLVVDIFGQTNAWVDTVWNMQSVIDQTPSQVAVGATSGTLISAKGTYIGNGWSRIQVVAKQATATGNCRFNLANAPSGLTFSTSGAYTFTAAGTETFWLYGPQMELAQEPTSYVITGAGTVTRGADVLGVPAASAAGPTIIQTMDVYTKVVTRTLYQPGGFTWPTGVYIQSIAVYPPSVQTTQLGSKLIVGAPY